MEKCIYCQHEVSDPNTVPAVSDTDAWDRLAEEHAADCEWVTTRAHRLDAVPSNSASE